MCLNIMKKSQTIEKLSKEMQTQQRGRKKEKKEERGKKEKRSPTNLSQTSKKVDSSV